jgi:hypothetical protein
MLVEHSIQNRMSFSFLSKKSKYYCVQPQYYLLFSMALNLVTNEKKMLLIKF